MPFLSRAPVVFGFFAFLAGPCLLPGQAPEQTHVGQYSQAEILRGSEIYANRCAVCHGLTGNALVTVDLARNRFRDAVTDQDLRRVVRSGIPNAGMPAVSLEEADLNAVIAFIRSGLGSASPMPAARIGDAARGRAVFEGKGGCLNCHRVGERGSRVAPDLTTVGSLRTAGALYLSLIDPTSAMLPINRPVRAVTKDGRTITGRRLNEDTYNVLLIDEKEQLVALEKSMLRNYQILTKSLMPSYKDKLTPDEIADVLGYLVSRKEPDPQTAAGGRQVTNERLLNASKEPHNWLTYSGDYNSRRYSLLTQITPANVKNLELKWMFQANITGKWQATPLVVDGIMYVTQRMNDVVALDARSGQAFWIYRHPVPADHQACCGANNRGLAIHGDTLYMGTLDGRLIAIDSKTGRERWNVEVVPYQNSGYAITLAPLVVKNKVLIGVAGGENGIRGFLDAYDVEQGKRLWRLYTIPGPGEPGHDTWKDPSSQAWKSGGASIWITGSYDPSVNLTYWGTGNPGPDWNPAQRPGDNLYSDSVIAVDPDSGKMKWHFQFTPHDLYDFDSVQVPVLADINWRGSPTKVLMWANRNGFFYVLNRETGKFLFGRPFVKVNWASGLDANGRPIQTPPRDGSPIWPGVQGGTNWYSPSYSPRTGLFYIPVWENNAATIQRRQQEYQAGRPFTGGGWSTVTPVPGAPATAPLGRGPINNWTEATGTGAVLALDPHTGETAWKFTMTDVTDSGILTTASDLLFSGGREGNFQAIDARTGKLLWMSRLGGQIVNGPITYSVDGKQYVTTIAGLNLVTFGLRDVAAR